MLGDSFKLFKSNFKTILILSIFLSIIPSLILSFIGLPMIDLENPLSFYSTNQGILYIVLGLVFNLLTALLATSIISISFSSKKQNYKTSLSLGSKYWISYILLTIAIIIAVIILTIPAGIALYFGIPLANALLIILGLVLLLIPIYFMIKSSLAQIILVGENKGVFASIKTSLKITNKKFWKLVLYFILIGIILIAISLLFSLIGAFISTITGNIEITADTTTGLQSALMNPAGLFIQQIFALAASLITFPIFLFFLKNLYSKFKENKK